MYRTRENESTLFHEEKNYASTGRQFGQQNVQIKSSPDA